MSDDLVVINTDHKSVSTQGRGMHKQAEGASPVVREIMDWSMPRKA
jgi:hypothetical protein